jgi:tetratricopeptide (TPR) repeat protein
MKTWTRRLALLALASVSAAPASSAATPTAAPSAVTVREETITIPTWEIGPPAVHPLWPGPQGPIYPYTLNEILTDHKVDKEYHAVFLENEYVEVLILPEIGGRVHGARDKTNGYVWLYWQPTIKPGLISMTGAWISGGIEWNFPHGHRPSGFMPVDHRVVRHEDGSATVWVGETEPVFRMRWLVGLTLSPGRSRLRADYVFVNPTDERHPFQFWATGATHANESAQAQYPGHVMSGHGKQEFWHWPIDHGVDQSWWKNVPNASSFFAWQSEDDWFGTYDHHAEGGTVHVADHRVMPGKKLWTWGSGPSGRIWEDILSDGGGPYFEPQAGAFSDNQPDYHWMAPQQVRTAHDYWYPVRDIHGFKKANEDFAVNASVAGGKAFAGVAATGVFEATRVVLETKDETLVDTVTRIAPDRPFTVEVAAAKTLRPEDLHLTVRKASGEVAIELRPSPQNDVALPVPFREPGPPAGMTADELIRAGEWLDRFRRRAEALPYYREALRRDPSDSRAHAALGAIALDETRWPDALDHFTMALGRDTESGSLRFGLGQACLGLRRYDEARDHFALASRDEAWSSAAHLELARLDLREGALRPALDELAAARAGNGRFADIPALAATAHRLLGESDAALASAEEALALDPMHFMGGYEKTLALRSLGRPVGEWEATWRAYMRDGVQNDLELASAYMQAGLLFEADAVLANVTARLGETGLDPMVRYLRGFVRREQGDDHGAAELFGRAAHGSLVYVNPHRVEEMDALEAALAFNPGDAHAHHLLGNVLYGFGRREEGLEQWHEAVALDDTLELSWRNVGYAERQLHGDLDAAREAYVRAFELDPADARVLLELDQVAEERNDPLAERRERLEAHRDTVNGRDDLVMRWVDLRLATGDCADLEEAQKVLLSRHFHTWEGLYGIHHIWVDVNQRLGDFALEGKDLKKAVRFYEQAATYPANLETAPRTPDFQAHVNWTLAHAYLETGHRSQARPFLDRVLAEQYPRPSLGTWYHVLAERALGHEAAAAKLLDELEETAREYAKDPGGGRHRQDAIGDYLLSLVLAEKGDPAGAKAAREKADALDPHPARAALRQAQIQYAGGHQ